MAADHPRIRSTRCGTVSYEKRIVCLANSRKPPSGICVAGRELDGSGFGGWVRLVSSRPTREVSLEERRIDIGRDVEVLDVIRVRLSRPEPERYQTENQVFDDRCRWKWSGTVSWEQLQPAVEDPGGPLWLNGDSSSHGQNDRVAEAAAAALGRSLYLVRPDYLRIQVGVEGTGTATAQRRVRARFRLAGCWYCLAVTDIPVELDYLARPDGRYVIDEALLCVSLGEVFHGHAYKLAAAVITPQRAAEASRAAAEARPVTAEASRVASARANVPTGKQPGARPKQR